MNTVCVCGDPTLDSSPTLMTQASEVPPALRLFESHLVDALHASLLQVGFGSQEVGVLRVVHRLLEVDVYAVGGP